MKTRKRRLSQCFLCGLLLLAASIVVAHERNVEEDVKKLMRQRPSDVVGPGPYYDERRYLPEVYSPKFDVPMDEIEDALIKIVDELWQGNCWDEDRRDLEALVERHLCQRSMGELGYIRCIKAVPLLKKIALSDHKILRMSAVGDLIEIGGEEVVPVLRIIVTDKRTRKGERWRLYEQLWDYQLSKDEKHGGPDKAMHAEIVDFLISAVHEETDPDAALKADKILCKVDNQYKQSVQREAILTRLGKNEKVQKVGKWHEYIKKEQAELQAIPENQRTTIKVRKLSDGKEKGKNQEPG